MFTDIFQSTSTELFADSVPEKKTKKNKKAKKKDYKEIMKSAPQSPFVCKTHNPIKLRFRETSKSNPACKSCGFKCQGERGYLACPESSGCFILCSACKICPLNHNLRHCVSLKQYETNPLYAENKFKCFSCNNEKSVKPEGVYHCGPCSFSICLSCIEELDKLWEDEWAKKEQLGDIKEEEMGE